MSNPEYRDRDKNRGALFMNHRKRKGLRDPDYRGEWTGLDGPQYWLSAWVNEAKSGKKYLKVKLGHPKEPPRDRTVENRAPVTKDAPQVDFDDEIPF